MQWNRLEVKGVWKTQTGCFAQVQSSGKSVALDSGGIFLRKGMVLQGLFSRKESGFAGKEFWVLEKHVPPMGYDRTSEMLAPLGLSDFEMKSVYRTLGKDTSYTLLSRPSSLKQFSAVFTDDRMRELDERLRDMRNTNDVRTAFPFLPKSTADLVYQTLGREAVRLLRESPYQYCSDTERLIRFVDAEQIYMHCGGNPLSDGRVNQILSRSLVSVLGENGDMALEVSDDNRFWHWMDVAEELSGKVNSSWRLSASLLAGRAMDFVNESNATLVVHRGRSFVYPMSNAVAECQVGELGWLAGKPPLYSAGGKVTLQRIESYCKLTGYVSADGDLGMDDCQMLAVVNALRNRVSVIAGGPGRGKTTITACICDCWRKEFGEDAPIWLVSLTGKAVSRLRGSVAERISIEGIHTRTIASVAVDSKVEVVDGLVIVDEASMVDTQTLARLVCKLGRVQVVFVGDVDQLPSIGAGQVLHDFIDSGVCPVTRLDVNYRARGRDGRTLADNADAIAENRVGDIRYDEYFQWYDVSAGDAAVFHAIVSRYEELLRTEDAADICLLSPFKSELDAFSVVKLNLAIHRRLHEHDKVNTSTRMVSYHGEPILVGDRVVVTRNLSDIGVVNGDTGKLTQYMLDGSPQILLDSGEEVVIPYKDASKYLEMGYALTVHKSQGSEYRHVLFAISSRMLAPWACGFATRNLVYTAVTRSSSRVHLFGSKLAFERSLNNVMGSRLTLLVDRLRGDL